MFVWKRVRNIPKTLSVLKLCSGVSIPDTHFADSLLISKISVKSVWFCLFGFDAISNIVGYLMPNPVYTYILSIYDLVWLGFMAYQPL